MYMLLFCFNLVQVRLPSWSSFSLLLVVMHFGNGFVHGILSSLSHHWLTYSESRNVSTSSCECHACTLVRICTY